MSGVDKYKYREPKYTESLVGVPKPKFPVDGFVCVRRVHNPIVGWLYYLHFNQWVSEANMATRILRAAINPPTTKGLNLPRKEDVVGWEKLTWNCEPDWAVPVPKYHVDGVIILRRKYFFYTSSEWYEGWDYQMYNGTWERESRVFLYQGFQGASLQIAHWL